jgi:hypothetical protein
MARHWLGSKAQDCSMPYAKATSLIENFATDYLVRRASASSTGEARRLGAAERDALRRQERLAIVRAGLAGAVVGTILAGLEIALQRDLGSPLEIVAWRDQLSHWVIFLGITLLVSAVEIAFLYWNALGMASRYGAHTGLPTLLSDELEDLRARGLARAALELPDPRDPVFGIDPYARVPGWRHWLGAILYRLKVGTTNLVLRALVRRVLGRAAFRFMVPLLAIPVFVVWNGLITWWALRQSRIRAFGALAVREHAARMRAQAGELNADARRLVVDAAGEALARNRGAHPNLVLLLNSLVDAFGIDADRLDGDWSTRGAHCAHLRPHEQQALVDTLALAIVIDGRIHDDQRQLLQETSAACGLPCHPDDLERLRTAIMEGRGLGDS